MSDEARVGSRADVDPLLRIEDVVARTTLSDATVRRAIRDGELRAMRLRGVILVRPEDLEAWLDQAVIVPKEPTPVRNRRPRSPRSTSPGVREYLRGLGDAG